MAHDICKTLLQCSIESPVKKLNIILPIAKAKLEFTGFPSPVPNPPAEHFQKFSPSHGANWRGARLNQQQKQPPDFGHPFGLRN